MTVNTWNVASGATLYAGRNPPSSGGMPAWAIAAGAAVDKVVAIPNTAGYGGAIMAYSCWAFKSSTSEIIIGAAGGHHDSSDNRVVSMQLNVATPTWTLRHAPSTTVVADVAHYPDGTPVSRHLYQMAQHIASTDRLILAGCRFGYDNAVNHTSVDTFNLATNSWDAAGYNQDVAGINGAAVTDYDGVIWYGTFTGKFDPVTRTWGAGASGRGSIGPIAHPWATDSVHRQVFGLSFSNGEDHGGAYGSAVNAGVMRAGVVSPITITPGAALTQFTADRPAYGAMDYDPINDFFLYYDGSQNRFYKIVLPIGSSTATMTLYTPTFAFTPALSPIDQGVMARFTYVPALKGFVGGPATGNLFFIQTSI